MLREGFRESEVISEQQILTLFPNTSFIYLIPSLIEDVSFL